ncbi:MAG: dockerin type I domain-containing protein [Firmicutes bacterium]|nr:dockerin type I domain-containing protein [Bacillota bacterium]
MSTRDDVIGWELIPNLVFNNSQNFGFFPQRKGHIPISPDIEITDKFIDANFLAAVREITGVAEGPIFNYDVYTLETLNVSSKNIADLAGIEYFENISTLSCQNNLLTELDLSKNIELQTLNCSNNLLTVLDISNCTLLRQIGCGYNHLTKLNVTNCSVLNSLNCTYNDMTSPTDVSGWEQTLLRLDISFKFYPQNGQTNAAVPVITKQPESITISVNETATLSVEAEVSLGELTYQWFSSNGLLVPVPIPGATSSVYDPPTTKVGMLIYACQITNTDSEATGVKTAMIQSSRAMVTVTASSGVRVSGLIKSYYPTKPATLQLIKNGETAYTTYTSITENSYGQTEQPFVFTNVASGTYDLVITKEAHTKYTVKNIVVETSADLDLTQDPRPEVQLMTLRCGDINGDGMINNSDLMILWNMANYNKSADEALNGMCDLNGDGMINNLDLTILWLPYNYNRGEIIVN